MNTKVLYAVFKRNFVGYFANPTGYVFICVFVLLSSIAAFLPNEFVNANLANLDQLNLWFPLIMLVFVPAITMGIWADERRQGTDELLLTIPASDFDIVLGKFKAAVSIYSVSLLFSLVCNLAILGFLGQPDIGLFLCTYIGYWFVGIAMLSIGMVASFLTGNLTVSYILGAIFCAPFIALQWIDAAPVVPGIAEMLKNFSIAHQFELYGRGIVGFSSILYFGMITSTMLYLSMVLIGRRHWTANQRWIGTFHYSVRTVSLLAIGLSLCFLFQQRDWRADLTEEKLSTLSRETVNLLRELKPDYPVVIEVFLSPEVPESHVQTRLDIISVLGEIQSICGKNVSVRINNIKPNTKEALNANQRFEIKPQEVFFASRGTRERRTIFLGAAFQCGLRSLTLPFIDRGLSVEYELVHALCNVTQPQKKKIGILKTDAPLFGRFNMSTFQAEPEWEIVAELKKQYVVVEVDPLEPIREKFDALVAVQPSAMGPQEINNFVDAVRNGQPTVIFEDPLPFYVRSVSGTGDPNRVPQSQMMMMMGRNSPKGDITQLWDVLHVAVDESQAIWQDYQPIRKLPMIPTGFVFLDRSLEKKNVPSTGVLPFAGTDPISASLQYMMLPFPGRIIKLPDCNLEVTPLLQTFQEPAGVISVRALMRGFNSGDWKRACVTEPKPQELAVRIRGELPAPPSPPPIEGEKPIKPEPVTVNVVFVADVDLLSDMLFNLRKMGNEPGAGINLDFDNVTFVLNAIDSVAGDERFLAIRTRRPKHRTLSRFDKDTDKIRKQTTEQCEEWLESFKKQEEDLDKELADKKDELKEKFQGGSVSRDEVIRRLFAAELAAQKRLDAAKEKAERELSIKLEEAQVKLNENIRRIQGWYKFYAVALPPIPPLLIAFGVFFVRRIRESEGVPQSRRRK